MQLKEVANIALGAARLFNSSPSFAATILMLNELNPPAASAQLSWVQKQAQASNTSWR